MRDLENIQGSRIYGRRQGKPLTPSRQKLVDELLPRLVVDAADSDTAVEINDLFAADIEDLWFEVGFGKGEHLAWQAAHHPNTGFIGCEPFLNGIAGLLGHVEAQSLENVRIFTDDARLLMDRLPDASIGRFFVLFPDPWPKARHHKRRFINPGNLDVIARLLKDGAELRVGTDHMDYCRWTLMQLMRRDDFEWIAAGPDDWRQRPADWPPSRYEAKALTQGRKSAYLRFRRKAR
tara:strand:+ start:473 stop:1177 length:705 start_codon:yes stop_codon:yes gene_type:complete